MKGKRKSALLIIDMLNTFAFPEGRQLARRALPVARKIAHLKERCIANRTPVIYVNDNFGQWRADRHAIFETAAKPGARGAEIAKILKPTDADYFVLKPKHSGFYSTNLNPLLEHLGSETLILTGVAGDICVLFTAHDAHMREYEVRVPKDCVASNSKAGDRFLQHRLTKALKLSMPVSSNLVLNA